MWRGGEIVAPGVKRWGERGEGCGLDVAGRRERILHPVVFLGGERLAPLVGGPDVCGHIGGFMAAQQEHPDRQESQYGWEEQDAGRGDDKEGPVLSEDVRRLGWWRGAPRKGEVGLLLDEFLDRGTDAPRRCADPLPIGAI